MKAEDVHDVVVMTGTSVLGTWVSDFIREAYSLSERDAEVHSVDGDDLPEDAGRKQDGSRVFLVAAPGRRVMDLVAGRQVPVVAVLDDPVDSVRFLAAVHALDIMAALRQQTRLAAGHHLLFDNPAVLLVERGSAKPARGVLGTLMGHLGLRVRGDAEAVLLERFAGPESQLLSLEEALASRVEHYARLDHLKDIVSAEDVAVVRQVLSPVVLGAVSRDIGPITWVARTFLFGDRPNEPAPQVVDLTGGARIIFYGPYFHLPPGLWRVRLIVAFSAEAKNMPFLVNLYSGSEAVAKVKIRPDGGGAFEAVFAMRHTTPERGLEVHFISDEGTIEGHLALGQLSFTREAMLGEP